MQVTSLNTTHSSVHGAAAHRAAGCCRRTVRFAGRVQGVGFRYTTRNIALRYDVTGYVRNLPDGRVELVLEGAECECDRVVDDVQRKMSGFVRSATSEVAPTTGEFDQFAIRH